MTNRINQKNPADCAMCCVAMFCGITYEQLMERAPWLSYLTQSVNNGGMTTDQELHLISVITGRTPLVIQNHYHAEENTERLFEMLKGKPAILSARSLNFFGGFHAVYWDGTKVIDPSNKKKYTRKTIIPFQAIV